MARVLHVAFDPCDVRAVMAALCGARATARAQGKRGEFLDGMLDCVLGHMQRMLDELADHHNKFDEAAKREKILNDETARLSSEIGALQELHTRLAVRFTEMDINRRRRAAARGRKKARR